MIRSEGEFATIEILAKVANSPDYCESFQLVGGIVGFRLLEGVTGVVDDVFFAVRISLREDCSETLSRSVGVEDERSLRIREGENGGSTEGFLERVKCVLCLLVPDQGNIFSSHSGEWLHDLGEILDEVSIV